MAGIGGFITKHKMKDGNEILDLMLQSMMHETFYTKSEFIDEEKGWYLGGIAIKGSFADCMPIYNETHEVVMFLVGECFVDTVTTSYLKNKGHEFSTGDASCLVHLYEEEGERFIEKLNGWFSGCIVDRRRGKAFLFNDWYGMRKIYYHEDEDGIYFSSEAKALFRAIPELREVDPQSIGEYLCFDCVLNDRSYFSKVHLLPGGSLWVFQKGGAERKSYFDLVTLENQSKLASQPFFEELIGTFEDIMPRYFSGDEMFISVTGGLDTRLMLSCLPSDHHNIKAITFGGMYGDCQDLRIGREVSKACNLEHHTIRHEKDFLPKYSNYVERAAYITDGLTDPTWADELYFNQRSRLVAPIKLTGVYGSQVLGRVRTALRNRMPDPELISDEFMPYLKANADAIASYKNENNLSYLLKRELPWYWSKSLVPQLSQLTVRSPFLDKDFVKMLYRAPAEGYDGSDFELQGIRRNNPRLMDVRTNRGVGGKQIPLISNLMHMLNKYRALGEKILNWDILPYSLQHLVTRVDTMFLSPVHITKLFLGFEYFRHYNLWYRRELAPYVREILLDKRTLQRPYWNKNRLIQIVNDHVKGRGRYLSEIRKVLTVELIHRVLIEG